MNQSMLKFVLLATLLSLSTNSILACDIHGHSGFIPENNLKIPVGVKSTGGLTQTQFNWVMDKMSSLYSGIVAARGAKFIIDRRWSDPTVNAYADQNTPGAYTIHMFGGLARHPEVTVDAMALVACHELGHHLGGAPTKPAPGNWAANEGQADYWGAMKCLRHFFDGDNQQQAMQGLNVPSSVVAKCNAEYSNYNEQLVCQRSAMAGLALGNLLSAVTNDRTAASYDTPDRSVVAVTFDDHPQTQCRLDTFLQASLCDHTIAEADSATDPNIGVCSLRNGNTIGNRPTCWYRQP